MRPRVGVGGKPAGARPSAAVHRLRQRCSHERSSPSQRKRARQRGAPFGEALGRRSAKLVRELSVDIHSLPEWARAESIAVYDALPHEVDLRFLVQDAPQKQFYWPVVVGQGHC